MTRLKELRESRGIKQEELAFLCGVSQSTISLWEIGKTTPRTKALEKLADRFGVSVGYILGFEDEQSENEMSDLDLALYGEIRVMSEAKKREALDLFRFLRQQDEKQRMDEKRDD